MTTLEVLSRLHTVGPEQVVHFSSAQTFLVSIVFLVLLFPLFFFPFRLRLPSSIFFNWPCLCYAEADIALGASKAFTKASELYAMEGQFMTATKYMSQLAEMYEREDKWIEACEAWESAASFSESDHASRYQSSRITLSTSQGSV